MTEPIVFRVGGPPKGKSRPRPFINQRGKLAMATPSRTKAYEETVAVLAANAMRGRPPLDGPLAVTIVARFAIAKSWSNKRKQRAAAGAELPTRDPDIDNIVKSILDGCEGIVFLNDNQVVRLAADKRFDQQPGVDVRVEPFYLPPPPVSG